MQFNALKVYKNNFSRFRPGKPRIGPQHNQCNDLMVHFTTKYIVITNTIRNIKTFFRFIEINKQIKQMVFDHSIQRI